MKLVLAVIFLFPVMSVANQLVVMKRENYNFVEYRRGTIQSVALSNLPYENKTPEIEIYADKLACIIHTDSFADSLSVYAAIKADSKQGVFCLVEDKEDIFESLGHIRVKTKYFKLN